MINSMLFVCKGNICRSPTMEAVMKKIARERGFQFEVDSAGVMGWHTGETPDERSIEAAERKGYHMRALRARRITSEDFARFDVILAADRENVRDLMNIAPKQYQSKIHLFHQAATGESQEIPDPYYGTEKNFESVLALVERLSLCYLETLARNERRNMAAK